MNVVLAFVLYTTVYMVGMPTAIDEELQPERIAEADIYVGSVFPNTPAGAVLKPNDRVLSVRSDNTELNAEEVLRPSKISEFVSQHENKEVFFEILRRDEYVTVSVTPARGVIPDEPERVAAGFSMTLVAMDRLSFFQAITAGAERTYTALIEITVGLGTLVKQAFEGTADYSTIAGPVGIVGMVGDAAAMGFTWLLTFTALISLNLAVINLLPVPALDGGRLLFVIIESITRRPIKPVVARWMNQVGFILLLALMAFITVHDILKVID
jgi:regulator of sigma E protease